MNGSFRICGLHPEPFAPLFALSNAELQQHNVRRVVATEKPGFPCRVSLRDAEIGEELILLSYTHQAQYSPYLSCGPIFVRRGAQQYIAPPGEVPDYVRIRLLSVRVYDSAHLMIDATVCEGTDVAAIIQDMLEDPHAAYIHLHNAKRGCFSCRVEREALTSEIAASTEIRARRSQTPARPPRHR